MALSLSLSLMVGAAEAACPSPFGAGDNDECGVDGSDVCTKSGTVVTCDLSAGTVGADLFAVEDYSTEYDIEIWGEYEGETFCCEFDDVDQVAVTGTDYADELQFMWSALTYNLQDYGTTDLSCSIDGGDGNDIIKGSNASTADEVLDGEEGNDTILGNAGGDIIRGGVGSDVLAGGGGNDTIDGEGGDDTIQGEAGADYLYGGEDDDVITGGDGDDTIWGEEGSDRIAGGNGDDTIDGGDDRDTMCGDAEGSGGDVIYAGDTVDESPYGDIIYSSSGTDTCHCESGNTKYDGNCTDGDGQCAANPIQSSRPVQCP